MANIHKVRFNYAKRDMAKRFGVKTNLYTVDYTALDQTPVFVKTQKYFLEDKGQQWAQPPLPNACYYCLHGDFDSIEPGMVVVPLENTTSLPVLTCLSKYDLGEIVGFRTSKIGEIRNGATTLYTNIRFDYATASNYPERSLARELLTSPQVPTQQVLFYSRSLRASGPDGFDTEGLLFVDISTTPNVVYKITQDVTVGNITLVNLELSRAE